MSVSERAEDAAKEIAALVKASGYSLHVAIAEIVQRAMDDYHDDIMQDAEGS